jgi:hypothetical protein
VKKRPTIIPPPTVKSTEGTTHPEHKRRNTKIPKVRRPSK